MSFRLIEVARQQRDDGQELTFIHIPNVAHKNFTPLSSQTWQKLLPSLASGNAKVLQFQHDLTIEEPFSWSQLLDRGVKLLKALDEHRDVRTDFVRPLVLITEGLGGLILKKTLVAANQLQHRHRNLLKSIVGLVLIGVPHIRDTDDDTLKRLETLLRPGLRKVSKKSLAREQVSELGLLSDQFRAVNFSLPEGLISGYETVETSLATGRLNLRKVVAVLVDKEFARMEWPRDLEHLLPIDVQLEVVLQPNQPSRFRMDLADYISKTSRAAVEIVELALAEREERERLDALNLDNPVRYSTTASSPSSSAPASRVRQESSSHSPQRTNSMLMPSRTSTQAIPMAPRRSSPSEAAFTPPTMASMPSTSSNSDSSWEVIPGATTFIPSPRCYNFPSFLIKPHVRNEAFWPRTEAIKAIEDVLLPGVDIPPLRSPPPLRTFVLHGIGGVGKTEVATEFCFKHKDKYDAVFFLHADKQERLASELTRVADMLGLEKTTNIDATREAVLAWLAKPVKAFSASQSTSGLSRIFADQEAIDTEYARWLIVFDNADDPETLFKYCWPREGKGSILVTTRDSRARNNLYFGKIGHELQPLSTSEATAFLQRTVDQSSAGSEIPAKAIVERLGGLPLAIEQIGAFISLNNYSLQRFSVLYKDDKDLENLQDLRLAENRGYAYSIAGVFALESLPPGSQAVLSVVSFLEPDCIHSRLLIDNLEVVELSDYPRTEVAFTKALSRLGQSSIISRGFDDIEIRIHRLVQDVARAQLRKAGQLEKCFDVVVDLLWNDFPRITGGGVGRAQKIDRWEKCEQLFPHITQLREFYEKYVGDKGVFKSQRKFADLLNEAGWYQFERSNPAATEPVVELAQQICEGSDEDYTEQLAKIFGTRTWTCALTKQFDRVFRYATERLELEQKMFEQTGKITANLAAAYNDKGAAYSMNKLSSKAFELVNESQRLRELLPGFKPEHNFSPLHERSLAHYLQGEFAESAECLLKAVRDRIAALGENDHQSVRTGQLYYALGNTRVAQAIQYADPAFLDEGVLWHQKALVHFRATAGDNHYKTACACFRVAEHCIRTERYDTARNALDQAIKVFHTRLYYRQEHSRTLFLYSGLCRLEGKMEDAHVKLVESVKLFNDEFPEYDRTVNNLTEDDFKSLGTYDF